MKFGRFNHIGVATPSIADSIDYYREVHGAAVVTAPFNMLEQVRRLAIKTWHRTL